MSVLLDATSLIQSAVELRREARVQSRDFLDHLTLTSDPTVRAVFAEDVAAIAGDVVALIGVALHQRTGSSAAEGVESLVRELDRSLRDQSDYVRRVDIVPIGAP